MRDQSSKPSKKLAYEMNCIESLINKIQSFFRVGKNHVIY